MNDCEYLFLDDISQSFARGLACDCFRLNERRESAYDQR